MLGKAKIITVDTRGFPADRFEPLDALANTTSRNLGL